jgi:hypothetical protein
MSNEAVVAAFRLCNSVDCHEFGVVQPTACYRIATRRGFLPTESSTANPSLVLFTHTLGADPTQTQCSAKLGVVTPLPDFTAGSLCATSGCTRVCIPCFYGVKPLTLPASKVGSKCPSAARALATRGGCQQELEGQETHAHNRGKSEQSQGNSTRPEQSQGLIPQMEGCVSPTNSSGIGLII